MSENLANNDSALQYVKSLTLLCVEDNKTTQLIYEMIFEDLVGKLICVNDGQEGYQKFLDEDIDIIISDYEMPNLNGLDMIEKIRVIDKYIPIILVSAIEEIDIIVKALQLNINNFVKKPIKKKVVIDAVISASKLLIANSYLQEQSDEKIKELEEEKEYSSYQEDLGFAKELNILRNDFYYQMLNNSKDISLIDLLYQPLDVMSGDAYSVRKIDKDKTFYFIVDGMGKGISASLTSMIFTSYLNHVIDILVKFDLNELIKMLIEYIKPILLDEEAIAVDFAVIDNKENMMQYSKFAMPPTLLQNSKNEILKVKSNNPPLSKYQRDFKISQYDISDIDKFLFYSDGVVENITTCGTKTYAEYIEEDFKSSFTREDLKIKLFEKINVVEDDITLIFINNINLDNFSIQKRVFETSLDEIDVANEWYNEIVENISDNHKSIYNANIVFTELYMNAYEHGNLGLSSEQKHLLLENDTYFETLQKDEKECSKKITVEVSKIVYDNHTYLITKIDDEGDGFDIQMLSEIFRNARIFNGRGVFVSRNASSGIYYNEKGNSVLYLNKL